MFVALQKILAAATLLILAVSLGCGGSGATPRSAPEIAGRENAAPSNYNPLADTQWRLVEIQSMDDAISAKRPDDPSLYTMRLNADGKVHMRLNCNRATGTWTAEPSADPSNGRFRFGLLATTKALCPPPRLDEKIVSDAKYVRGYLLRDNRLYLSLYADGGIYAWEPISEVRFSNEPNEAIEDAILQAVRYYTKAVADIGGAGSQVRYIYNMVDLNGDGNQEALVYLLGSIFCGSGGCDLFFSALGSRGTLWSTNFPSVACRSSYHPTKPTAGTTLSDPNPAEERCLPMSFTPMTESTMPNGSVCRAMSPLRESVIWQANLLFRTGFHWS